MGHPAITQRQVQALARLARLRLDDGEEARMTKDIGRIIEFMRVLAEADLGPLEPPGVAPVPRRLRQDEPRPGLDGESVLGQSAWTIDGFFVVPPRRER